MQPTQKILKQLFQIINEISDSGPLVLSLRMGDKDASFAITNKTGTELYQLVYCTTAEWNERELTNFFESYTTLKDTFYEVLVSYDFPHSIFVPSIEYKQDNAGILLEAAGATTANVKIVSELVTGWQLYNLYTVPGEILEWIDRKLPAAKCRHQYSLHISNMNVVDPGGLLAVDFRKEFFTVVASNNNKLLLAQTFEYTTPEDVLYFLLKTCQQFSLTQQDVKLQLSGLVDKQSSLYKELYHYFINMEFREAYWKATGDYPAHFFTLLNDLARCAS